MEIGTTGYNTKNIYLSTHTHIYIYIYTALNGHVVIATNRTICKERNAKYNRILWCKWYWLTPLSVTETTAKYIHHLLYQMRRNFNKRDRWK